MQAWTIRDTFGIDSLTLGDQPAPEPGPGEVLIDVRAVSLNFRDLLVAKGQYNPRMQLPVVPCSDGVGTIARCGSQVSGWKPGDRVAGCFMPEWLAGDVDDAKAKSALGGGGTGMLARQVVLPAAGVVAVPAHLSDVEAATLPCAAVTAWNALFTQGKLGPGETVLVQGTGGVSLFATQFALLAGARVIATSSSDEKLKRMKDLGVSDGINYKTVAKWDEQVRALTGGRGVDHVVEVGGVGTLGKSLKSVRKGGRISMIGVLTGMSAEVNLAPILMNQICIQGIYVGSKAMFEAMNQAIALHKLKPFVDRVFPFSQANEAYKYLESGVHFGKVCIEM